MPTNRTRASRAPYFPFYGDDFYGSQKVILMSPAAEGVYMRLLWIMWRDGTIPADKSLLQRLVGKIPPNQFDAIWDEVAPCWTESEPGRLVQPRLDEIRRDQEQFRRERSQSGRRGNESRWGGAIAERSLSDRRNGIAEGSPPSPPPIPSPEGKSTTPSLVQLVGTGPAANGREDLPPVEGRGGVGREGFDLLMEIGYRSKSNARSVDILAALRKFGAEGGDIADLKKLCGRAKRKGRDPGGMMAKWLDGSEWQKELQRR